MLKLRLFLFPIFFVGVMALSPLFAQEVLVKDALGGGPLSEVIVLDTNGNFLGQTRNEGKVNLNLQEGNKYIFQLFGYQAQTHTAESLKEKNYTLVLVPLFEEIDGIELVSKKKRIPPTFSMFECWEGGIIAVTKSKKHIVVFDESQKPLYRLPTPKLENDALKELFKDAAGRFYLVGKDQFVQLYITDQKIYKYDPQPIDQFNTYIKSLELVTPNGANIYRDLSRVQHSMPTTLLPEYTFFNTDISYPKYHNCGTDFIAYQLGKDPEVAYSTIDTNAFYAANREFFTFVNLYIRAKGSPLDRRWGLQQHSYNTLFGRFKEMPLFNYENKILVFDVFNNQLVHVDQEYKQDTAVKFDLSNTTRHFVALQDQKNERIWLYQREKHGRDLIYELKDGLKKENQGIFIDAFARNIRVQNDNVYFLNDDFIIERKPIESN
ncbi:MAG: hypothetical protein N4A46_08205 [Schleiferiaceae bacterium]|jgi:hypothetical protein|nr:hypothetical protein [Schleiferiaceae bacterium]